MKRLVAAASLLVLIASCTPATEFRRLVCANGKELPSDPEWTKKANENPALGWTLSTKTGKIYEYDDFQEAYIALPTYRRPHRWKEVKMETAIVSNKLKARVMAIKTGMSGKAYLESAWTINLDDLTGEASNYRTKADDPETYAPMVCMDAPINHPIKEKD